MSATLRRFAVEDLIGADQLRAAAGWNQTISDWRRLLSLELDGCFVAEQEGRIVGTATTTRYGDTLAWIGMMLVHPDCRRQGIGQALVQRCIGHLRQQGVRCIKLDATPQGKPLYERLGFLPEWTLARWENSNPLLNSGTFSDKIQPSQPDELQAQERAGQRLHPHDPPCPESPSPFPLPQERGCSRPSGDVSGSGVQCESASEKSLPLPEGEGRGEGETSAAHPAGSSIRPIGPDDWQAIVKLDADAFGVSREPLLQALAAVSHRALVVEKNGILLGFGMVRDGARADYLGPITAKPEAGSALVGALLSDGRNKPIFWDIPDQNEAAVVLARQLGFSVVRPLTRMYLETNSAPSNPLGQMAIAEPATG